MSAPVIGAGGGAAPSAWNNDGNSAIQPGIPYHQGGSAVVVPTFPSAVVEHHHQQQQPQAWSLDNNNNAGIQQLQQPAQWAPNTAAPSSATVVPVGTAVPANGNSNGGELKNINKVENGSNNNNHTNGGSGGGNVNGSNRKGLLGALGVVFVLFVLATIGLSIALGIINEKYSHHDDDVNDGYLKGLAEANQKRTCSIADPQLTFPARVGDVFDAFTSDELGAIATFVKSKLGLADAEPDTITGADWLYMVDNYPAPKATVLAYLDGTSTTAPGRYARAIVYRLTTAATAKLEEYQVGPITGFPINTNTPCTIMTVGTVGTSIPYLMRPVSSAEYAKMEPLVASTLAQLDSLMSESYGEKYADGRMWWTDSSPRAYTRSQRRSWLWVCWFGLGMYQLPMGLELLIDHTDLNPDNWSILQVVYNDQPFASAAALQTAYTAGGVTKLVYPFPGQSTEESPVWSSLIRRGTPRALASQSVPLTTPQGGRRFGIKNGQVQWMGWDLHVGHTTVSGTMLNDIRFRGDRLIYEMSLQDAFAGYSGFNPIQATSTYSDGGWGLGSSDYTLIPSVDCPPWAVYLDSVTLVEGKNKVNKNSVCVWEQPDNIAVMRHYDQDFVAGDGRYTFVAGYPRTTLVVRTSSAVYNYDYIISYIFNVDGTMEVNAAATGYPQATIYPTHVPAQVQEAKFSQRLSEHSMGSLHDHLFVWKVDMDILGTDNSLVRSEIKSGYFDLPYVFPGANTPLKYIDKQMVANENSGLTNSGAAIRYNPNTPTTFSFVNTGATNGGKNAYGVQRSYNIYLPGTIAQLNNQSAPWMPAVEWSLNNVVVTQRKDSEQYAAMPLYDIQAPGEPIFRFSSLSNGESLTQTDLVAWITMGTMHLPSAEDAPVTNTPGTGVSFFLRPANYYDISPTTDLSTYFYRSGNPVPGAPAKLEKTFLPPPNQRCSDPSDPAWVAPS